MNAPFKLATELNVAAAVEYSQEQKAQRDQKWALETAKDLAALLISGARGATLEKMLHERFPRAPRGVVFSGIGIAMTWHRGDLAVAQLEARILRHRLAEAGIRA